MRTTTSPIEDVRKLRSMSKRAQAIFLNDLEDILIGDSRYDEIRKSFLDCINGYTRDVANMMVGTVEDLVS